MYDIYNPTKAKRIIYDGISNDREIVIEPNKTIRGVKLSDTVRSVLLSRKDDLVLTEVNCADEQIQQQALLKSPLHITGMHGMGDNLHQRAIIRQLLNKHEIWLESSWVSLYHDLISDEFHIIHKQSGLRTQTKNAKREADKFDRTPIPRGTRIKKNWYTPEQVRRLGSVLASMCETMGCDYRSADFRLPINETWANEAQKLIDQWKPQKPIMIYRPPVARPEWGGAAARNPDPKIYAELFNAIRDQFFVVSVADLVPNIEWIVGKTCEADVKFHSGELPFETLAALFSMSKLVFTCPGFPVVLAQAVNTPHIAIFGGYESSVSYHGGARYVPYLGIDTMRPCQCFSHSHNCCKQIDVLTAKKRINSFLESHVL